MSSINRPRIQSGSPHREETKEYTFLWMSLVAGEELAMLLHVKHHVQEENEGEGVADTPEEIIFKKLII